MMKISNNMKKIRNWRIMRRFLIWKRAWKWTRYFIERSGTFTTEYDRNVFRARLRKEAHTIEKGLSLPAVRTGFGKGKVAKLLRYMAVARDHGELERDVEIAQDVISSYVTWHADRDISDPDIESLRQTVSSRSDGIKKGGVIPPCVSITEQMAANFDAVVQSRRSVRNFSADIVPNVLIEEAISVAWCSPSVCNRQPWAVALVQSPDQVKALLNLQAGNRGFEQTIANLIVILADTKAFVEDYEIFEPFVDAGIFSGALVNALHSRNIGSCCLNLCVSHSVAERIIKVLDVPDHLFPVMMIAFGYAADGCEVAMSSRGPSVVLKR